MSNKSEKKQNIVFYSKKFFQLLADKFENNISYRYKLLIIKNEKNNQYSVNLAIDTDNNGNKNKIAYFTYKNFKKSVEALTMDSIDALDDEYFLDEEEPEAL